MRFAALAAPWGPAQVAPCGAGAGRAMGAGRAIGGHGRRARHWCRPRGRRRVRIARASASCLLAGLGPCRACHRGSSYHCGNNHRRTNDVEPDHRSALRGIPPISTCQRRICFARTEDRSRSNGGTLQMIVIGFHDRTSRRSVAAWMWPAANGPLLHRRPHPHDRYGKAYCTPGTPRCCSATQRRAGMTGYAFAGSQAKQICSTWRRSVPQQPPSTLTWRNRRRRSAYWRAER